VPINALIIHNIKNTPLYELLLSASERKLDTGKRRIKLNQLYNCIKTGLHYQSFCDHSRNFAQINSKFWKICKKCLGELLNNESVPSKISYKSFKTQNLPMQNSYCDHRNFDSVNQPLEYPLGHQYSQEILAFTFFHGGKSRK
jgi:hypothetical protein